MKTAVLLRTSITAGLVLLGVSLFSAEALAWSAAAHTYMTGRIAHKDKLNICYGSYAADIFNFAFDNTCLYYNMDDQFHHDSMPAWDVASSVPSLPPRAAACGFVSHNDVWGEDATAHHGIPELGQDEGYIIAKAEELKAVLEQVPEYQELDIPDEVGLVIAHELVENSVDILVTRLDPNIGRKIIYSAMGRSRKFPVLLADAYAAELADCAGIGEAEARGIIIYAEEQFRKNMMAYGSFLSQDEQTAVLLVSEQMAEIAGGFLAANGITLPEGTDLVPLAVFSITTGMDLCEDDFEAELNDTASFVDDNLSLYGVSY